MRSRLFRHSGRLFKDRISVESLPDGPEIPAVAPGTTRIGARMIAPPPMTSDQKASFDAFWSFRVNILGDEGTGWQDGGITASQLHHNTTAVVRMQQELKEKREALWTPKTAVEDIRKIADWESEQSRLEYERFLQREKLRIVGRDPDSPVERKAAEQDNVADYERNVDQWTFSAARREHYRRIKREGIAWKPGMSDEMLQDVMRYESKLINDGVIESELDLTDAEVDSLYDSAHGKAIKSRFTRDMYGLPEQLAQFDEQLPIDLYAELPNDYGPDTISLDPLVDRITGRDVKSVQPSIGNSPVSKMVGHHDANSLSRSEALRNARSRGLQPAENVTSAESPMLGAIRAALDARKDTAAAAQLSPVDLPWITAAANAAASPVAGPHQSPSAPFIQAPSGASPAGVARLREGSIGDSGAWSRGEAHSVRESPFVPGQSIEQLASSQSVSVGAVEALVEARNKINNEKKASEPSPFQQVKCPSCAGRSVIRRRSIFDPRTYTSSVCTTCGGKGRVSSAEIDRIVRGGTTEIDERDAKRLEGLVLGHDEVSKKMARSLQSRRVEMLAARDIDRKHYDILPGTTMLHKAEYEAHEKVVAARARGQRLDTMDAVVDSVNAKPAEARDPQKIVRF